MRKLIKYIDNIMSIVNKYEMKVAIETTEDINIKYKKLKMRKNKRKKR